MHANLTRIHARGLQVEKELKAELQAQCEKLKLSTDIKFTWYIPPSDVSSATSPVAMVCNGEFECMSIGQMPQLTMILSVRVRAWAYIYKISTQGPLTMQNGTPSQRSASPPKSTRAQQALRKQIAEALRIPAASVPAQILLLALFKFGLTSWRRYNFHRRI